MSVPYELNDTLYTLQASAVSSSSISKTFVQRALYLCAATAPEAGIVWPYAFSRLPFGPFNKNIASALNRLVAYRFAETEQFSAAKVGQIRAWYRVTALG